MADHTPVPSPVQDQTKSMSSILGSAKFFTPLLSPTSTLDSKPFFPSSLCGFDLNMSSKLSPKTPSVTKHSWGKLESNPIGLALISSEDDLKPVGSSSEPRKKMVVFGTRLKVKIPPSPSSATSPISSIQLPKSPSDFGIKTRNNNLRSPNSSAQTQNSPHVFTGCRLSVTEMELSEEYTRVIFHGPNPKTTHIFDDCVLESCYGDDGTPAMSREESFFPPVDQHSGIASESFLSFCWTCKNRIGPGNDIFIYRGERAFCSGECRSQEMELERKLTTKEASLPQEPTPDDENAVNLLVRMPDGSRRGRRFLKSDKLLFLFDFIEVGRAVTA